MSNLSAQPIMIVAGGTGGHMFPGVALARALSLRGHRVVFVSDARGAAVSRENLGLPAEIERYEVSAGRLGGGIFITGRGLLALIMGFTEARRLVRRLQPSLAVGFGGYPTIPPILAAGLAGVPTIIHEQNAVLGRANRRLARGARAFALSFERTAKLSDAGAARAQVVGNPVREEIAALATHPYTPPTDIVQVLVLGGSLGAQVFSKIVPAAFESMPPEARLRFRVAQQCRPEDIDSVRATYRTLQMPVELATFFDDVPQRLARSHMVICRAGASTVAEMTAAGRPALYVPFPHAADDHQTDNARAVENGGGGWVFPQPEFTPGALAGWLEAALEDPQALASVANAARTLGNPSAADRLADMVEGLLPLNGDAGDPMAPLREAAE
ncbi:MAG: undecaprenyldiphospho-muramoylpentapeptide beta-N-acetylglucosaminyltransferase [Alphaproteobacteria bacterium]|nr:undecaprenyldiphospho-muramoylpentapeptide beta-N-acetylglucosaminyltransferase [Alphaproteobacteria bacterium]MCZ6593001.1 undecaprenyldiphospho-muramoylpentapeptide beta-N-acetylglucosaminyltransferase [Alphaproteobacteria bacterium]